MIRETSLIEGGDIIWVNYTYVPKEYRRQGVFAAFFEDLLKKAKSDPWVVGIRLMVDADNNAAQKAYNKLGMESIMHEFDFNVIDMFPTPQAVT